jgi:hypothetical protein
MEWMDRIKNYQNFAHICFDTGIYVIGRYKLRTKTFNYQIPNTTDHHQDCM